MLVQLDLSGVPENLWLIGAVVAALGGLSIRMYAMVRRLAAKEKERVKAEEDRKIRDQAVWDAWRVEAEGRRQQVQDLSRQVLELQGQNSKLYETIFSLHDKLADAHAENRVFEAKLEDLREHNSALQSQVADLVRSQHAGN